MKFGLATLFFAVAAAAVAVRFPIVVEAAVVAIFLPLMAVATVLLAGMILTCVTIGVVCPAIALAQWLRRTR